MNNRLHIHFVSRLVRLLIALTSGGLLIIVALSLLSPAASQAQTEYSSPLSNGSGWRQSNTSGFGDSTNLSVHALEAFNGQLYADATNYDQGATIWHTANGISWILSSSPGFSNTYTNTNPVVYDLIEFNGQVYAGTGNWLNDGIGARYGGQPMARTGHQ